MNKELLELLEKFIDAKIEYQFAINEEGEDGYGRSAPNERKLVDKLKKDIVDLLDHV
jgi:hypothetical protein